MGPKNALKRFFNIILILPSTSLTKTFKYPKNAELLQNRRYRPSDYEFRSNFACGRPPASFLTYYDRKLQIILLGTF